MKWITRLMVMAALWVACAPAMASTASLEEFEAMLPPHRESVLKHAATLPLEMLEIVFQRGHSWPFAGEEGTAPDEETFSIAGVYPPPESTMTDELVFYFSEPLEPLPEQDDAPPMPLMLVPHIPGRVEMRDNRIRFSSPFLEALARNPHLDYLVVYLHPALRSVSGRRLPVTERQQVFCMPEITLDRVSVSRIHDGNVQLRLTFSRSALQELAPLLTVRDVDGQSVEDLRVSREDGSVFLLDLPLETMLPVTIEIARGLLWGHQPPLLPPDFSFDNGMPMPDEDVCGPVPRIAGSMEYTFPRERTLTPPRAAYEVRDDAFVTLAFREAIRMQYLPSLMEILHPDTGDNIPFNQIVESDRTLRLLLDLPDDTPTPSSVLLRISPFLGAIEEDVLMGRVFEQRLTATTRPLQMHYHSWSDQDIEGYVLQLHFNAAVAPETFEKHIQFQPHVDNIEINTQYAGRVASIRADWRSETVYTMRLTAGLTDTTGNTVLDADLNIALNKSPLREGAVFESPGLYYFPRRDTAAPGLKARNITEAKITASRIFPSNLSVFVRNLDARNVRQFLAHEYARELGEITVNFPDARDVLLTGAAPMDDLLPAERRGVFLLSVEPAYSWRDSMRVLLYTDIGVLAHWTDGALALFVHDLHTLEAIGTAQVSLYSSKHQLAGITHTDAQGVARFMSIDASMGVPALVVIEKDDDYAYLDLREQQETRTSFAPDMPYYDRDGYDAYLYLDRNLYRPGETVHVRWIARTRYVDALTETPLQLRIANPHGRWIHEARVEMSEFGTGGISFESERIHPTGRYAVELRVPEARQPIGRAHFNLEEFVPNRMRAAAHIEPERLLPGDTATITVTAENLFGGMAAGRKTEARMFLRPRAYESEAWPGYHFGNEDAIEEELFPLGESVTDDDGRSAFSYTFVPGADATMPLDAVAGVRVLEVGGRAVTDTATVTALPDVIMLGVAAAPRPDRELMEVHVVALNSRDETPADLDSVQVTLDRQVWDFHMRRFQRRNEPRWEKTFVPVQTHDLTLTDGRGTLELPYPDYGEYRLRVHSDSTRMYSAVIFNRWWGRLNFVSESRPDLIRLTLDKDLYHPGDRLRLRIESPYDGRAFVVVQGERFKELHNVPIVDGEGMAELTVAHAWFPNVWLQATAVRDTGRPHGARYPYSSFAMVNVPLDNPEHHIETVFLDLPEEIRPAEPFTVTLETRTHDGAPTAAELTVAAVDEGIHSILGYDRPDPYGWFQRSRRFDMRRAHYYDKVFFDPDAMAAGGDMMRRLGITSQVDENWIKPVALWSGSVRTDDNGQASIRFDVPEFIGQLRLTAVAANNSATGAADARVYSRRPYLLRTSMPRFALPGDRFICTASAVNMTGAPVKATVRWEASGTLSGGGEKRLELPPNGQAHCRAPITAGALAGEGAVTWTMTVTGPGQDEPLETLKEFAPLPVRRAAAYQTETEVVTLHAGESRLIENTRFTVEPAFEATLRVTGDPLWQLRPGIEYLLRFPYGCVEQVTSQAMPLYLLRNYAGLFEGVLEENTEHHLMADTVEGHIRLVVDRLFAMQTLDGGLGTWPGASTSYAYGSVYALHFLTLVRRGRVVDIYEEAFAALQDYVLEIMRDDTKVTASDYYLRAYACYVLALDGSLEAIAFIPRLDAIAVPQDARYLLAAAMAMHAAAPDAVMDYIETAPVTTAPRTRESAGTLHSPVRSDAVRLIALVQLDAPREQMQPLTASLTQYLTRPHMFTTQEAGFAVTALGMYLEKFHGDPTSVSAVVRVAETEKTISGLDVFSKTIVGEEVGFEIDNIGTVPVFAHVEMAGIPLQPRTSPITEGMQVQRRWMQEDGTEVSDGVFRHGEQYLVELAIKPQNKVENLLVTDLLPAGFEIANPRLETDAQPGMGDRSPENIITTPAHLEVRDDRIAFAVDELDARQYYYRYLVRAVTPGTFQTPALHAECMYLPAIRAATVHTEITIQ